MKYQILNILILFLILFRCESQNESASITGNWRFLDKDRNYGECYITNDSIFFYHDLGNKHYKYLLLNDSVWFLEKDQMTGDTAKKSKLDIIDNNNFNLEFVYWEIGVGGKDTSVERVMERFIRIDTTEFTMDKVQKWFRIDSIGRTRRSLESDEFEEAFGIRRYRYKFGLELEDLDKIINNIEK